MKNTLKTIVILVTVLLSSCKKPLDYYNKAVYAGNGSDLLQQMHYKIGRLQQGYGDGPIGLNERIKSQISYQQAQLDELKEFIGNSDSDAMIKAAYAFLGYTIEIAKAKKTKEYIDLVDNSTTIAELQEKTVSFKGYLDEIEEKRIKFYEDYDKAITAYAKAHNIEMEFIEMPSSF